jgi:hypothetical protein
MSAKYKGADVNGLVDRAFFKLAKEHPEDKERRARLTIARRSMKANGVLDKTPLGIAAHMIAYVRTPRR